MGSPKLCKLTTRDQLVDLTSIQEHAASSIWLTIYMRTEAPKDVLAHSVTAITGSIYAEIPNRPNAPSKGFCF